MLPHPPYVARREDFDLYADRMSLPAKPVPFEQEKHLSCAPGASTPASWR